MNENSSIVIDPAVAHAAELFLRHVSKQYSVDQVILFGSRARNTQREDSDADIAVVMSGQTGERAETAIAMAAIAFDVLLDTGILIQAVPFWESEFEHPEQFTNPALIENIRNEGVRL